MTRIAHLTDLHVLEAEPHRRGRADFLRLCLLGLGRRIDPDARRRRVADTITRALRGGADHLVFTGDLTEDGSLGQYETFADVLREARVPPEHATIVPGNHDLYASSSAWRDALDGPLRPYRRSASAAGASVLDDVAIIPISTAFHQPFVRSAGHADEDDLHEVDRVATNRACGRRALVVAQHHPPTRVPVPGLQWLDGLQNHRAATGLLRRHPRMHVLHGHTHRATDRALEQRGLERIFCSRAVVDGPMLRLYDVEDDRLVPVPLPDAAPTTLPSMAVASS